MDRVKIEDCYSLQLHIHVLGCYPEGESILVVLFDNRSKTPLQTLLIDCYEKNGANLLNNTLKEYGLKSKKLDYIIWTHPDHDHSVGFDYILKEYVSRETKIILPEGLNFWEVVGSWDMLKSWFAITKNKMTGKNNVERVNTSIHRIHPLIYGTSFYDGTNDDLNLSFEILTPFATQNFRHLEYNRTHKGNHLSISFVLRLGDLGFYFGGDTENMAIKDINKDRLTNLYFVKIPHHSSKTSDELPAILNKIMPDGEEPEIISVSTGYHKGKSNLPNYKILDLYKACSSKILLTEDKNHHFGYGVWKCSFNRAGSAPWSFQPSGDSIEYM